MGIEKSVHELEETYELLNEKELLQNKLTEREQQVLGEIDEKKHHFTEKYNQKKQDTTEHYEIKKREFEVKLKPLQENPLKKPFNLSLYVISVGMIFTIENKLLGFGLFLLTILYVSIEFYKARKNKPTLETKLSDLENQYRAEMYEIEGKQERELLKLDEFLNQERHNLNLEFEEAEKIRERLNSKSIVSEYYKNKESVKKFINLFLDGRAKNVEDCIRISEIDDRESELDEKELKVKEMSEQLESMNFILSKKEDDLQELEKILAIRERTLDFNQSLLNQLLNTTSKTDALNNELHKSIEKFESFNEMLKNLDKVLIKKVNDIDFRIEVMEKSLLPIEFKQLQSKVEEIKKEVKEQFNDMNRLTEKRFEDLEYKMYTGFENIFDELA